MKKLFLFVFIICFCNAKSMVVLDPASIEILYMIGAEEEIIAVPSMGNLKPVDKTSKLDTVGTFTQPNLEKILNLKPKIVILTSYSMGLKDQLEKYGIITKELPANTLQQIHDNILTLGKMTNREDKAKIVAKEFMEKIEKIKAKPINKSGIFIYSATPLMVFGGDTLPSDILETIGINNIGKHMIGRQSILDTEYLVSKNPDIILYGLRIASKDELVKSNTSFKYLKAINNNNVYFLELHSLLRGSPSIIEEIIKIKKDIETTLK